MNAQKEKNFWGLRKLPQVHEKVCDENGRNKQEKTMHVLIDGRKHFIRHIRKTGENDFDKLLVNDSGHNEGTSYLFSKWVNWCQGSVFQANGHHKTRNIISSLFSY